MGREENNVGRKMGEDWSKYMESFGYDVETGIDEYASEEE